MINSADFTIQLSEFVFEAQPLPDPVCGIVLYPLYASIFALGKRDDKHYSHRACCIS